jgi:hypothetical protein
VGWAHEGRAWVTPSGREAQTTDVVGGELKAAKENNFTNGETTACQILNIGGEGERRWGNHQNIYRKSMLQIPLLARQQSVFSAPANYGVVKITHSSFEVI